MESQGMLRVSEPWAAGDMAQLLGREDDVRGRVWLVTPPPSGPEQMGSELADTLVAVGAGGAISVLARGLFAWLNARRTSNVTVSVLAAGSLVQVKATGVSDVEAIVRAAASASAGSGR